MLYAKLADQISVRVRSLGLGVRSTQHHEGSGNGELSLAFGEPLPRRLGRRNVSFLVSRMGVRARPRQCIMGFVPEREEQAAGTHNISVPQHYH